MRALTKKLLPFGVILVCAATLVAAANYFTLGHPLRSATKDDPRNEGIDVRVHYRYYIDPTEITFDLREVKTEKAPADVTRVLLQFASSVKDRDFRVVRLAYKGQEKFRLDGTYFHTLGVELGAQNPIYTIRTMPENVKNLDGSAAFGTWTGGWLGVMSKQMEDVAEFHRRWYIADVVAASER